MSEQHSRKQEQGGGAVPRAAAGGALLVVLLVSLAFPMLALAIIGLGLQLLSWPALLAPGLYWMLWNLALTLCWSSSWRWLWLSMSQPETLRKRLRAVLAAIVAGAIFYLAGLVVLLLRQQGQLAGLRLWGLEGLLLTLAVLGATGLLMLPVLMFVLRYLGNLFAPAMAGQRVISVAWRSLPAYVLLFALLCLSPGVVYLLTGEFPLWLGLALLALVAYGGLVLWTSMRYLNDSLAPVRDFLGSGADLISLGPERLRPAALDEIGGLVFELGQLVNGYQQATAQQRDTETRLRLFAESSSDWFFETDDQLRFTWISSTLGELAGVETGDVIGRSALDMSATNYLSGEAVDRHIEDLRARRPYRNFRTEVRTDDGRHLHIEVSAIPWFDDQGSFQGYRGSGSNITEMIEAQQRLLEREAQLAQAQKMEAVGQLTGGIAHDFNNLLTAVIGNLELLRMSGNLAREEGELLSEALTASERGADLIRRLLAFSRRQQLRPRPLQLPDLLGELEQLLQRTLGEAVVLELEVPADIWQPLADGNQLQSAVLNLALNARDAMPGGGILYIRALNRRLDSSEVELPAGDYVEIQVADNGSGIAERDLPHVFEPFFSTKREGNGSGLGLSMVYGFCKQSGGAVTVESQVGKGTRIGLWLPRSSEAS